jgi:hypothetical protein
LLENGDPLANKKARRAPASATTTADNALPCHLKEKNPGQVPDRTHGSDDTISGGAPPQAIEVGSDSDSDNSDVASIGGEVTDIDDEAELGTSLISLLIIRYVNKILRSTAKGMGCTHLCFLWSSPID